MQILVTKRFKKQYIKLPQKTQQLCDKKLKQFFDDPNSPSLKNHPLKGKLIGRRAFSVTDDYRIIYRFLDKKTIKLIDLGTHSQVY
jgi:addiction module RelE/StbE family toxin